MTDPFRPGPTPGGGRPTGDRHDSNRSDEVALRRHETAAVRRGATQSHVPRGREACDRASLQGRGWAFLNLASLYGKTGRLDLAFVTFTKAQDVLGAAQDPAGVAAARETVQFQLLRSV